MIIIPAMNIHFERIYSSFGAINLIWCQVLAVRLIHQNKRHTAICIPVRTAPENHRQPYQR